MRYTQLENKYRALEIRYRLLEDAMAKQTEELNYLRGDTSV